MEPSDSKRDGQAQQSQFDLLAALEEREAAERAVDEALVAAMSFNKSEVVRALTPWTTPTFWRHVKAARERLGK